MVILKVTRHTREANGEDCNGTVMVTETGMITKIVMVIIIVMGIVMVMVIVW